MIYVDFFFLKQNVNVSSWVSIVFSARRIEQILWDRFMTF